MGRMSLSVDHVSGAGIMFHHFHGGAYPVGQGSISSECLADIIDFLGRARILDAEEWEERAIEGRLQKGDLCICFDDGLSCQLDLALPVLEDYGIRAFWFIYTSPIEGEVQRLELYRYFRDTAFESIEEFYSEFNKLLRCSDIWVDIEDKVSGFDPRRYLEDFPFYSDGDRYFRFIRDCVLSSEQYFHFMDVMLREKGYDSADISKKLFITEDGIKDLKKKGHKIGLHSHTHPTRLEDLHPEEQREEYSKNRRILEGIVERRITCMSHPCNSYGRETIGILREMGIKIGFRSNMRHIEHRTSYEYPREDHSNIVVEMKK